MNHCPANSETASIIKNIEILVKSYGTARGFWAGDAEFDVLMRVLNTLAEDLVQTRNELSKLGGRVI